MVKKDRIGGWKLNIFKRLKNIKITDRKIIFFLLLAGFLIKLAYIINTGWNIRQHDVADKEGHFAYVLYLMNGSISADDVGSSGFFSFFLPDFNVTDNHWQFYHPPLWHFICAVWMKIQLALGISFESARENLQILSLVCSTLISFISVKLFELFGLKGKRLILASALVIFHPTFVFLSGSINNDVLSLLLMLLSLYLAIKWYREPTFKRITAVAVSVGCAMMAKLSAGTVAVAIAFLFLVKFIKSRQKCRIFGQFAVFGAVCVPLALWWQIRNYVLCGADPLYIPALSEKSSQYIGFRSVFERFFDFSSLFDNGVFPARATKTLIERYGFEYFEYNIPLGALKSSLYGEYYIGADNALTYVFAAAAFIIAVLFCIAAVAGAVAMIIRTANRTLHPEKGFGYGFSPAEITAMLIFTATQIVSYTAFCFKYPHFCTMDFRYIALTVVTGALFAALLPKMKNTEQKIVNCP